MDGVNKNIPENAIIFRMGEETGIVIEKTQEQFRNSIFKDHYVKALQLANEILGGKKHQDASSNIIAFCADRGEGKTSCMQSLAELITSRERLNAAVDAISPNESYANITPEKMHLLGLIDPAYFDEKHNIIELITGMMYEFLCNNKCDKSIEAKTNLIGKFREVQKTLEYIEKASNTESPVYDPLEKVQSLSKGLKLRGLIEDLMDEYLSFVGKSHLVICIDDIDLNIQYAYRMTEQIRKYLSNEKCLILFATNIEQLTMVIRHSMEKELYGEIIKGEDSESQEMAAKYITKLLPTAQRINLVHITDLYDKYLVLIDKEGKEENRWDKAKEAITQLIYAKTRYLFYNNESETSPIVPRNLRSFRHLMKLLTDMPNFVNAQRRLEIEESTEEQDRNFYIGKTNKDIFKTYFYQVWILNNLQNRDALFARRLVEYTDIAGINLFVVQYLSSVFKLQSANKESATTNIDEILNIYNTLDLTLEEIADEDTEGKLDQDIPTTIESIINNQNRAYNITLGDVFYLLSYIKNGYNSESNRMLLFFIHSFYSMRLYEYYDIITEQKNTLYPIRENSVERVNIYRNDERYKHTNILQRFVNGSYFTYLSNSLLAADREKRMPRDLRYIKAKEVRELFRDVLTNFPENMTDVTPEMKLKFQMCEFLCWTISRDSYAPKQVDLINKVTIDRTQNISSYYGDLRPRTSLFVFDIMAPFYNAVNIQYAYNRIYSVVGKKSFYELAKSYPDSLLNNAIEDVLMARGYKADQTSQEAKVSPKKKNAKTSIPIKVLPEPKAYYTMLSSAIIRNADVLVAIQNHIMSTKSNLRDSSDTIELLRLFYNSIIKTQMYTYRTKDDSYYEIQFSYLQAFVDFLNEFIPKDSKPLAKDNENLREWFSKILFKVPTKAKNK